MNYKTFFSRLALLLTFSMVSANLNAALQLPRPMLELKGEERISMAKKVCKGLKVPPRWEGEKFVFYDQPRNGSILSHILVGTFLLFIIWLMISGIKEYYTFYKLSPSGLTMLDGRHIPWESIKSVTEENIVLPEEESRMAQYPKKENLTHYNIYLEVKSRLGHYNRISIKRGIDGQDSYEAMQALVKVIQAYQDAYGNQGTGRLVVPPSINEFDQKTKTVRLRSQFAFFGLISQVMLLALTSLLTLPYLYWQYREYAKYRPQAKHKLCTFDVAKKKLIVHAKDGKYVKIKGSRKEYDLPDNFYDSLLFRLHFKMKKNRYHNGILISSRPAGFRYYFGLTSDSALNRNNLRLGLNSASLFDPNILKGYCVFHESLIPEAVWHRDVFNFIFEEKFFKD